MSYMLCTNLGQNYLNFVVCLCMLEHLGPSLSLPHPSSPSTISPSLYIFASIYGNHFRLFGGPADTYVPSF